MLLRTLGAGARTAIEETLLRAQALVEETGARLYLPFIHIARAELGRLLGDEARRRAELRQAQTLFVEMGATGHAERLGREIEAGG